MHKNLFLAVSMVLLGCQPTGAQLISKVLSTGDARSLSAGLEQREQGLSGDSGPAGLASLQYFIESIRICESLETFGTGYSDPQGCLELYRSEEDPRYQFKDPSGNFASLADIAREDSRNFVDLLDATARQRMTRTTPLTFEAARSYNWGIINWAPPIKLRGAVSLSDGSKIYTHDGATSAHADTSPGAPPGYWYQTLSTTAFAGGPADTATVIMPNGGTWFRFQSPFTITESDLRNAVEFELDLAFNPSGLLKGDSGPVTHRPALVDSTGAAFTVPFLDLSPVPHPRETAVVKESYVASVSTRAPTGGNHDFDVRLELYTLASAENQGVYAASLTTLATPGTRFGPPELQKVSFLETRSDGSLDFQAWNREAMISSFRRGAQLGDVSTANLGCGTGQMRTIDCPVSTDTTMAVSFRLLERAEL